MSPSVSRRRFVAATTSAAAGLACAGSVRGAEKPAILGGKPVRTEGYQGWPILTPEGEKAVADAYRSGNWYRDGQVEAFEAAFAKFNKAPYCIATSSGTAALFSSLGALGVGPGDEVIVAPYTFMASVSVILLHYALPVFVDSDRETFMIDPAKIEAAITERTRAIIPVHIGGSAADLDRILAIGKKHHVAVIEDACQAACGQWRHRGLGAWGTSGCYSFQESKNLSSGEGGAILTNDEEMAEKCFAFHNCGRKRDGASKFGYSGGRNTNLRMTEFQAALLASQLGPIEKRAQTRSENAAYLSKQLREIPGITPARMYEGCTRNAYHIYMFRYDKQKFGGLTRSKFIHAMHAEGIPVSAGYGPLNKDGFIRDALHARGYQKVYGKSAIDQWADRNQCPQNDQLCKEGLWLMQNTLLGPRSDMDQIAEAVRKIHAHVGDLIKA